MSRRGVLRRAPEGMNKRLQLTNISEDLGKLI
jgi:hypothetical protein